MSAHDGFGLGGDAGLCRQPGAGGQCTFGEAGRFRECVQQSRPRFVFVAGPAGERSAGTLVVAEPGPCANPTGPGLVNIVPAVRA
jgi:hypothetical protein